MTKKAFLISLNDAHTKILKLNLVGKWFVRFSIEHNFSDEIFWNFRAVGFVR